MGIREVHPRDTPVEISGPIAGKEPVYLYLDKERSFLLYSTSLKELLEDQRVHKPLEISEKGISFYLLSGVIPTPYTIYKDVYVLNVGDKARVDSKDEKLHIEFSHNFPFRNEKRSKELEFNPDYLLDLLELAIVENIIPERPIYLFHSLGKDSNTLALALAKSPVRDYVTSLTLATGDRKDESIIASEIAKKLGFSHIKLYLPERVSSELLEKFDYYFENISHPCIDGASLAYPIYSMQIDFENSNVIDGSGNDMYFGHVPRAIEFKRQRFFPIFNFLRPISELLPTGNPLQGLTKTRAEFIGLRGFTYRDAKKIFPKVVSVTDYWKQESLKRRGWDYFDVKADLWGTNVEYDLVIRKVRNFAEVFKVNLILPWTDERVATYIGNLPERILFDRKNFRNKIPLRELLKERLGLDSDSLGKYSYGFDAYAFLKKIESKVKEEIIFCKLWNKQEAEKLYISLKNKDKKKFFRNLLVRLFIISSWYNHNRYLR